MRGNAVPDGRGGHFAGPRRSLLIRRKRATIAIPDEAGEVSGRPVARERVGEKRARPHAGAFVENEIGGSDARQTAHRRDAGLRHAEVAAEVQQIVERPEQRRRFFAYRQPPIPDDRQLRGVHELAEVSADQRVRPADAVEAEHSVEAGREDFAETGDPRGFGEARFHMLDHA